MNIYHGSFRLLLGAAFLFLAATLYAQGQILHTPPQSLFPGQDNEVEAILEGTAAGVREVRLLYNRADVTGFVETPMEYRNGYYVGTIPAEYITEAGVRYLIVAELNDGSMLTYPEQSAYDQPVFLSVERASGQTPSQQTEATSKDTAPRNVAGRELILSPGPGTTVPREEVLVAVTLFSVPSVDTASVMLLVDGVNVTRYAMVGSDLVTYRPSEIVPGLHTVEMQFADTTGQSFTPVSWRFQVAGAAAEGHAGIDVDGDLYVVNSYSRIRNRYENVNKLGGNIRTTIGGAVLRGNVYLTSRENTRYQPRNRYMFELNSARMQTQLGDFYPQFSRLGMWGKRIRGLNTRLHLKPFHLHVVYGRSQRLVEGLPAAATLIEQRQGYNWGVEDYTFGRRVLGIRPSVGNGQTFEFGLSFISSRDDTLSVLNALPDSVNGNFSWRGTTPKDNVLVGSDLMFAFDKRRITWVSSAALSWQNDNIFGGALSRNDTLQLGSGFNLPIDELNMDPSKYSWIFILNDNIRPFLPFPTSVTTDPADTSAYLVNFSPLHFNEYSSLAYETRLTLQYFRNTFSLQYRRVGPEYSALANPYLRRDVAGFELSDRIPLLRNKLHLTLRYQDYAENLSREEAAQISSNTLSAGIVFYPGQGLPVINLNLNQYHRANALDPFQAPGIFPEQPVIDNRINNRTYSSAVTLSQPVNLFGRQHDLRLSYMRSNNTDLVEREANYPRMGYSLSLISLEFQSRLSSSLATRVAYHINDSETPGSQARYQSLALGGMYQLLQDALQLTGTLRLAQNAGTERFNRVGIESSARYRFFRNHGLSMNLLYMQTNETDLSYNNLLYSLRYSYSF